MGHIDMCVVMRIEKRIGFMKPLILLVYSNVEKSPYLFFKTLEKAPKKWYN